MSGQSCVISKWKTGWLFCQLSISFCWLSVCWSCAISLLLLTPANSLLTSSPCLCHTLSPAKSSDGIPCVGMLTASFKEHPCSSNSLSTSQEAYILDASYFWRQQQVVKSSPLHEGNSLVQGLVYKRGNATVIISYMILSSLSRTTTEVPSRHLSIYLNDCSCA